MTQWISVEMGWSKGHSSIVSMLNREIQVHQWLGVVLCAGSLMTHSNEDKYAMMIGMPIGESQ